MGRVLKLSDDQPIKPASFTKFGDRPVNYFRDIVWDPPRVASPSAARIVTQALRTRTEEVKHSAADLESIKRAGFAEGREMGRQEALREFQDAYDMLEQYALTLNAERKELAARFEEQLVMLASQMAEKILNAELSMKPALLANIVRAALKEISSATQVMIRVHPQDLALLKNRSQQLAEVLSGNSVLDFRPDETLARGDCLVDSDIGSLDARLTSQLKSLREQLESSMEKSE